MLKKIHTLHRWSYFKGGGGGGEKERAGVQAPPSHMSERPTDGSSHPPPPTPRWTYSKGDSADHSKWAMKRYSPLNARRVHTYTVHPAQHAVTAPARWRRPAVSTISRFCDDHYNCYLWFEIIRLLYVSWCDVDRLLTLTDKQSKIHSVDNFIKQEGSKSSKFSHLRSWNQKNICHIFPFPK